MTPFGIAGIQMHIGVHKNIDAMIHHIDLTMHHYPWVQMVMFNELAVFGPSAAHAQRLPGPAEEPFQKTAEKHGIWIVNGSMYEKDKGKIYNTTSVINPQGEVVKRYRKMFPFLPFEEGVACGDEFCIFDIEEVGRFAISNCYDMWFPETSRTLTAMGVEVILHPVLTTGIDRDVDLAIAKSTAAMFQCYVFDINGLGAGGNGHSAVFDPSGRQLFQADVQDQIIPVEIDLEQVRRQREVGMRNLGQPLKSFRDRVVDFPVYDTSVSFNAYLQTLGPLVKPGHKSKSAEQQSKKRAHKHADII
ncbi:MAG: carbon-nitrogen hydrolase family protein [Gammaproteobacteria bacterium]|nr:carbon-nitrogen hydrolase family protein [Gammaproteobacteria bacterium]